MHTKRVLLIEKEPNLRTIMRSTLIKHGGGNVDDCSDAISGLQQAKTMKYDLIVSNMHMDLIGGISFTGLVRCPKECPLNNSTPILIITQDSDKELLRKAVMAGVNDIRLKPFSLGDYLKKINRHLVK